MVQPKSVDCTRRASVAAIIGYMLDVAGEVVDTTYYRADTVRINVGSMSRGVIEAAKLIGEGGHIEAWVPSTLAFGSAGCDSLGVKPNTMLYYEMWLIDVEKR